MRYFNKEQAYQLSLYFQANATDFAQDLHAFPQHKAVVKEFDRRFDDPHHPYFTPDGSLDTYKLGQQGLPSQRVQAKERYVVPLI
ncbi:MAG: hypothetical protein K0R63_814 [Rickettsiales bacterium]|jgi:hypothetical protein|nr:hypothetical protein [Rickettsiales bacterium]